MNICIMEESVLYYGVSVGRRLKDSEVYKEKER